MLTFRVLAIQCAMLEFSVIMPSFQHSAYLDCAIDSVLAQEGPGYELIVVDDGSTDGSVELLEQRSRLDDRLRLVRHARNQGIARTLNDGLAMATGDRVCFLMSDDVWVPGNLAAHLDWHRRFGAGVVWSDGEVIGSGGNSLHLRANEVLGVGTRPLDGDLFSALLAGNFVNLSGISMNRDLLNGLRFEESLRYLNDFLFVLELAARCDFRCFPIPLYHWRIHDTNTTQARDSLGWLLDARRLGELADERFRDRMGATERAALERFLSGFSGPWGRAPGAGEECAK